MDVLERLWLDLSQSQSCQYYGLFSEQLKSLLWPHMQQWKCQNATSQHGTSQVNLFWYLMWIRHLTFWKFHTFSNMVGIEYMLLHVQEPVLYVIRKQHRHSATVVTPMSDYYIIDGTVYQAPDLGSVVNSRIVRNVYICQNNSYSPLIFYLN